MDGQRKGSQSSRSLAITSGGHVTDTDHMVSRPKKVASLLPCPDGQPHEEPESDRAATPFQITMPDRLFSSAHGETCKAKEKPGWETGCCWDGGT